MSFQTIALGILRETGIRTRLDSPELLNLAGGLFMTVRSIAGSLFTTTRFGQRRGRRYIRELLRIAQNTGVRAWVSHGTLLGLVRQGRLLRHDKDIDFCVLHSEDSASFLRRVSGKGFVVQHVEGNATDSLYISVRKKGIPIDLYFVFPSPHHHHQLSLYFRSDDFSAERVNFLLSAIPSEFNRTVKGIPIPDIAEQLIVEGYGSHWRRPQTNWSIFFDPPNAHFTGIREQHSNWISGLRSSFDSPS